MVYSLRVEWCESTRRPRQTYSKVREIKAAWIKLVTLFRVRDDLFFERRIDGANQLVVPFRHLPRDRDRERDRER